MPIGIDLGTTYCAVAILRPDGRPEILPNREGEDITPSVVLFQAFDDADEPLVGSMAKRAVATTPGDVVQFVKRQMGNPAWRFDSATGAAYTAEEVSAIILRRLKDDAEQALGRPVTDAVITVPAYFDDARRRATQDAGHIAGLRVLRVLNEPTAAALAFGLDGASAGTVLVYDLGGGTFDVTLLRILDGEFDVLATDGDRNLGGFDFDNRMMQYVLHEVEKQGGPPLSDDDDALAALRDSVEVAKRSLTTVDGATVRVAAGGRSFGVRITRSSFEAMTADLLRRTEELADAVLEDAGLQWSAVDHLVLVGGSTRMPMIRQSMEGRTGRTADRTVHPDQAVALGAAIQAAMEPFGIEPDRDAETAGPPPQAAESSLFGSAPMPRISDVTSHSLGVLTRVGDTGDLINHIIIARNEKIPARFGQTFRTMSDGQTDVRIRVTQGEDSDPEYVTVVGEGVIALPPYPRGAPLEIVYCYDANQTIFVEVHDQTVGQPLGQFEVVRSANLDAGQIEDARRRITDLGIG